MQLFKKTVCFMLVLCAIPAAFGAASRSATNNNARIGIAGTASRMPTLSVSTSKLSSATTSTTTSSALLANAECIDAYTACIKDGDVCGENFEECTTRVLFHGKMPNCLSTLAQCSSSGVNSLFGTTNVAALSTVASKNTYGEVTDYTYPTDGSVLGQMITAAAISNRYDTSTCIRRYTSCLKKDTVCGADFELCTTDKEFRKQRVFCDSTLARCQGEGVKELLGSTTTTANPTKTSRVGEMIAEGAALAAVNAVSTCYKVVDQCILGTCGANPYKCYENSNQSVVDLVEQINNGTPVTTELVESIVNKSSIAAYIKGACLDTIGSSKYCYATFIGNGQMPTNAQLRDEDNQEEIYDLAYDARMNATMKTKIADLVEKFDTKAKQKCTETIKSCAMRVCGGGSGAACYSAVFGEGGDNTINGGNTYDEIKTGCAPIVNTDANCKYAAANPNSTGAYTYTYINSDAFDTLFPEYNGGAEVDFIGVVASLTAALATNYSDGAIANMKKQCQAVATSCVKSMCGSDYVNCYRNRTDIYSDLTNTGESTFDRSMNKVGGVLDYTVVLGLCLDTVKNASVCDEHLAIEATKLKLANKTGGSWGDSTSVRDGWIDAGSATSITGEGKIYATDENGNNLCTNANGARGICNTVGVDKAVYDTPIVIGYETYIQSKAAESLFQELIYDIEKEAQAQYNAKITKEQNMCMASNNGGIVGAKDNGSTFMWAKLKSNKVPANYNVNGLSASQFAASNDLYGSFCRVRVTLQSDDKKIQEYMRNKSWTTAYFATGDSFTCGSWIPESDLDNMATEVAESKAGSIDDAAHQRTRFWTTLLGVAGGGVGGYFLGQGITDGSIMSGMTGLQNKDKKINVGDAAQSCVAFVSGYNAASTLEAKKANASSAIKYARIAGVPTAYINVADTAESAYKCQETTDGSGHPTCTKDSGKTVAVPGTEDALTNAMNNLSAECAKLTDKGTVTTAKKTGWITPVATGVSALAGGVLVYKATRDIQSMELDEQQKAAYEEWMNNVGRHISCYIGGDEAGSYGDVITTSLE